MKIDILTIFPEMFEGVLGSSILKRAQDNKIVEISTTNFRDFATDKHKIVDDTPYGGGGGMVLKPEPIFRALDQIMLDRTKIKDKIETNLEHKPHVILMCPQGEVYNQKLAEELAEKEHLVFICGHYEGYDERIREYLVDQEISIGDYVMTGGELAAMVVIDSVVRLLPGSLGNMSSAVEDSHSSGLLEYPHYTKPQEFRGMPVPEILISGHHQKIEDWRHQQALIRTAIRRPDILAKYPLTAKDKEFLKEKLDLID